MPPKEYVNYVFTHNNYQDTRLEDSIDCKYIIYGKEICPTTKTPHLQGTISFKHDKSENAVRNLMPGCHVKPCVDLHSSIAYCKKEGDYTERGKIPLTPEEKGKKGGDLEKKRWETTLALIKGPKEFHDQIPADIQIRYARTIDYIHAKQPVQEENTIFKSKWFYGPSRTGKTTKARLDYPDHYLKLRNKWWDHYQDQSVVILDDFDKTHAKLLGHIKDWADKWPFQAESKGSVRLIRPRLFIVTSNYHPKDIWPEFTEYDPVVQRFEFTEFKRTVEPVLVDAQFSLEPIRKDIDFDTLTIPMPE